MSTLRGMAYMATGTLAAATMNVCARFAGEDLHPFEIAFFRCLIGLIAVLPICLNNGGFASLHTGRIKLHALRGLIQGGAMLLFFAGLALTPLATVVALQFTTPLFSTLMAVLLLGEAMRKHRMAAVGIGFIGTLVIVRPGFIEMTAGPLVVLGSAFLWGAAMIVIKRLSGTESSLTQTFYGTLFMTPITLAASIPVWTMPSLTTFLWLIGVGVFATAHNLCVAQAFREAELSAVAPLDFAKMIWISMYAVWIFEEPLDGWTWLGAFIIFASTTFLTMREKSAAAKGKV
jgi:drug/metabolite transporter (DMT)-like permease